MKINYFEKNFPFITIEDVYNDNEIDLIWEELNFLCYKDKLKQPNDTNTAISKDGVQLKKNLGLWIDDLYSDRNISNILKINRKIFYNFDNIFKNNNSWFYKNFEPNYDTTLLSYYEDKDNYLPHTDNAYVTILTWFYKLPKVFTGGDLFFPEYEFGCTVKNNCSIIFPSRIMHEVNPVKMGDEYKDKKYGRFCMTQFLHILP